MEERERILVGEGQEDHQGLQGPGAAGFARAVCARHRPKKAEQLREGGNTVSDA